MVLQAVAQHPTMLTKNLKRMLGNGFADAMLG